MGTSLTFREDMYNLAFISQVKSIYKESCESILENSESRRDKVKIKAFGAEPKVSTDFEEDNVDYDEVSEEEEIEEWNGFTYYAFRMPL